MRPKQENRETISRKREKKIKTKTEKITIFFGKCMVQRVIIHINEQKKNSTKLLKNEKLSPRREKKNLDDDHDHHHHKVHHQHLIIIIIIFDCHRKWIHRKITIFVCVCVSKVKWNQYTPSTIN